MEPFWRPRPPRSEKERKSDFATPPPKGPHWEPIFARFRGKGTTEAKKTWKNEVSERDSKKDPV